MESRLSARLAAAAPSIRRPVTEREPAPPPPAEVPEEEAVAASSTPVSTGGEEPSLPAEETERAMLAELRERGEAPVRRAAASARDEAPVRLPSLDELVKRIPAPVRETLDDLFRAKFTGVRRVPTEALKVAPGGPGA